MNNLQATLIPETLVASNEEIEQRFFIAIYDCYFKGVCNYIRYRCEDPATAEDLTAVVFEKALTKITDYQPTRSPFAAWLFAIARNVVNMHLRGLSRQQNIPLDDIPDHPGSEALPEQHTILTETTRELANALTRLNERERDLLSLKFAAHLTNRRIAEITGLSESNVGVILYRSILKLRTLLEHQA